MEMKRMLPLAIVALSLAPMPGQAASIGDYVWNDMNRDGHQDAGEYGLPGVPTALWTWTGGGPVIPDTQIATTTTDADGLYLFSGLLEGHYFVEFDLLHGFAFTVPDAVDEHLDSDVTAVSGASGMTGPRFILQDQDDPYTDAGMTQCEAGEYGCYTGEQIPEPATLALMGLGLAGIGYSKRRKLMVNRGR